MYDFHEGSEQDTDVCLSSYCATGTGGELVSVIWIYINSQLNRTPSHIRQSQNWPNDMTTLYMRDWCRTAFSDEKTFSVCIARTELRTTGLVLLSTIARMGGSIIVWAEISSSGKIPPVFVDKKRCKVQGATKNW